VRNLAVVVVVIAACSSPEDRLADLQESGRTCAAWDCRTLASQPIDPIVECMNYVWQNGGVAEVQWTTYDAKGYDKTNYVFAVDHEVRQFTRNTDPFSAEHYVTEDVTCTGPFRAAGYKCGMQEMLAWDGCP
jgi:hypothetical protein